jgi:peptidyl-prolyl cis-trans isomerase D
MLLQMRSLTRGWVAYVLLFVLSVAFAIWGIQDMFRGVGAQEVARVGGEGIGPPQLSRELDIELRNLRAQGLTVTRQEAIEEGLHLRVLERMIGRRALDAYADRINVSASDAQVAEAIRQMQALRNPVTGAFDQTAYETMLSQLGFTRTEFEEEIRAEITRGMFMEALTVGSRAPSSFGAILFTYETETRIVSLAEASASAVGQIPAPNEAQLQAFWEENQERLRVPEYRSLTLVVADPSDFVGRVNVPEPRLREEFEARRAALTRPERRTYVRLSAQNEQQANDAAARLNRGENAEAVASALGLQVTRGADQTRNDVPDSRVAEAVFSQPAGQARAVRGQLTPWAVVRVESVTAAAEPSFEAMRDELRQAIAADEASDLLNEAIGQFEDARASGAAIPAAAAQSQLTVINISAVDETGRNPSGAPVEPIASAAELLRTAFQTPEGEASDFIPVAGADVVVAVQNITPATVRPLSEVRDELAQVWMVRERTRRLRELGQNMIAAVREGQGFSEAARRHGFNVLSPRSQPINRRIAAEALPQALGAQIFAAAAGAVVSEARPDGGAVLVAHVEQINRIDPAEQPQGVEQARLQMQETVSQSIGEAVQDEIIASARVQRNTRLLDQLFPRTPADETQ